MPTTGELAAELVASLDRFLEADLRRRHARATTPLERDLEASLARAWRRQGQVFVGKLTRLATRFTAVESANARLLEAIREDDWLPLFDEAMIETLEAFVEPISLQTQKALLAGAKGVIADLSLGTSFELASPAAIADLRARAAARVAGINDTTRDALRRIIGDGVAQRKSYSAIAREIKAQYSRFAVGSPLEHIASRAELVAVTEIGDAYESGARGVADRLAAAGLEMQKQWLDVGDRRVDPVCAGNAAEGWIPIDQGFGGGVQQPTQHPGCRCTTEWRRRPSEEAAPAAPTVDWAKLNPEEAASALEDAWGEERYTLVDRYVVIDAKPKEFREAMQQVAELGQRMPNARFNLVTATPGSGLGVVTDAKGAIAQYRFGVEGMGGKLEFSDTYWKKSGKGNLYPDEDAHGNWHPGGTSNPAGYITHEFGHSVMDYLANRAPAPAKEVFVTWVHEVFDPSEAVSDYGKTNADEKFAALFQQAFSPDSYGADMPLPTSLRDMLIATGEWKL